MHLRKSKQFSKSLETPVEIILTPENPIQKFSESEIYDIRQLDFEITTPPSDQEVESPDCIYISREIVPNLDDHSMNHFQSSAEPQKEQKPVIGMDKRFPTAPSFIVGTVTVKAEELGLVMVVLILWAGAISLFINRWGKLRMLEPYQPAYTAPEPSSPPRTGPQPPFINIHSTSNPSLNDILYQSLSPTGSLSGCYPEIGNYLDAIGMDARRERRASQQLISHHVRRERRASQQTTSAHAIGMGNSPSSLNIKSLNSSRRVRSAVDLVSLVMQEKLSPSSTNQFIATNV